MPSVAALAAVPLSGRIRQRLHGERLDGFQQPEVAQGKHGLRHERPGIFLGTCVSHDIKGTHPVFFLGEWFGGSSNHRLVCAHPVGSGGV